MIPGFLIGRGWEEEEEVYVGLVISNPIYDDYYTAAKNFLITCGPCVILTTCILTYTAIAYITLLGLYDLGLVLVKEYLEYPRVCAEGIWLGLIQLTKSRLHSQSSTTLR